MPATDPCVVLRVDFTRTRPVNPIWSFGGNTCHAPLWTRDDLNLHLAMVRERLGFRYIRAHGTLGDNIGTICTDGSFDFTGLLAGIDRLLSHGLRPFLELSHMPSALARDDRSICAYRFRASPPADWSRWSELIEALMAALIGRYGVEELRQWYFEVWNEPDIPFWSGTQREYFRLYDLTARAVKQADPQLRVGGPATARTNWIDEFLDHVSQPSEDFALDLPRCDFVSTHAYPSDLEFLDSAEGSVTLQSSDVMGELFTAVRRKVDRVFGSGFPVICGEWNSSAGPFVENHDTCNNAAFVVKTMVELSDVCQGSLVWNISDIYEEMGFHYEPFHGGYGLLTVNSIPKAAFYAFEMLHQHDAGERLPVQCDGAPRGVGALASRTGDTIRLLMYYYREPGAGTCDPVEIKLDSLPATDVQLVTVRPGQGSAYETWRAMGSPMFVTRPVLDALEAASTPATTTIPDGPSSLSLEPGTITQLTFTRSS